MKKPTVEELTAFVAKHISYDASETSPEIKCQHCGKVAREGYYHYWIDHRGVLVSEISGFLGLKVHDQIDSILEDAYIDEDKPENARRIAEAVLKGVFE